MDVEEPGPGEGGWGRGQVRGVKARTRWRVLGRGQEWMLCHVCSWGVPGWRGLGGPERLWTLGRKPGLLRGITVD